MVHDADFVAHLGDFFDVVCCVEDCFLVFFAQVVFYEVADVP